MFAAAGTPGAPGATGVQGAIGLTGPQGRTRRFRTDRQCRPARPPGSGRRELQSKLQLGLKLWHVGCCELRRIYVRLPRRKQSRQHSRPKPRQLGQCWSPRALRVQPEPRGPRGRQAPREPTALRARSAPRDPPVTFRGGWLTSSTYAVGDTVGYGGGSYIALVANSGREPDVSPIYWAVLAQVGAAGSAGPQGRHRTPRPPPGIPARKARPAPPGLRAHPGPNWGRLAPSVQQALPELPALLAPRARPE